MKNFITTFLSNPKKTISIFAVIAVAGGALIYTEIGRAPAIPASLVESSPSGTITPGSNVSLSFGNSGKVEAVLVHEGDAVHKGQILARLSAPEAQGKVEQAKGALDLAEAQYSSLNSQYSTTKAQQDLIVQNAYNTLLSSSLEGTSNIQDSNTPIISGTYTCGKEGSYILKPYRSGDGDSGISINFSGLETGVIGVKYDNSVPMGSCGLQVKFVNATNFNPLVTWAIKIPNTNSSVYLTNKNAYELAVTNRDKALADISTNIGNDTDSSVAKAQIVTAEGAYQAALGAYQNNLIISPVEGTISFVDVNLKVGQSVTASKSVISINAK